MLWLIGKDDGEGYETKRQAYTAQYQQRSSFTDLFQPDTSTKHKLYIFVFVSIGNKDIHRAKDQQR